MKLLGLLMASAMASFAAGEAVLIQNADIYPMTGAPLKGGSLLIQDGKIVDIGAKISAPKGATVLEGKGLRVYPGWIDSGTASGWKKSGPFAKPTTRARSAISCRSSKPSPRSIRIANISASCGLTELPRRSRFPGAADAGAGAANYRRPGCPAAHRRLDVGRNGDQPLGGHGAELPDRRRPRRARNSATSPDMFPNAGSVPTHAAPCSIRSPN